MCGIGGFIGKIDDGVDLLRQLNRNQRHRGPDDQGHFVSDCGLVGLAMTRLSIIDHQRGQQPMTIDNGTLAVVFNGEIFNAAELRAHLENEYTEQFDSNHSDTEVLLRMYKYYGYECFEKFNGMFAVAIYDRTKRTVTLCRDYFGIKPLVYSCNNNRIIFSSEIRALLDIRGLSQSLDNVAISHYLDFGYINAPHSIYEGVKRLQAGHLAEIDLSSMSMKVKAWKKRIKSSHFYNHIKKQDLEQQINREFCSAVERWSLADVPLCYSLSGGLDSSAIAGAASRRTRIETYSVGYKSSKFKMWNEIGIASEISKEIQSQHNEIIISISDVESDINRMINIFSEPYGGGLPSYYLFKAANANGHRVIVTGVGGDELFGNYGNAALYKKTFPSLRSFEISNYISSIYMSYKKNPDIISLKSPDLPSYVYALDEHLLESLREASCIEECVHIFDENTQLPNEFLSMIDLLSMSFSVEARTPFLDMRLADLVLSIPTEFRNSTDQQKELMLRSLHDIIPLSALGRKKSGFSLPLSILMRHELRERFSAFMSKKCLIAQGCYHEAVFDSFVKPFIEGDNRFVAVVWRIFALQWWFSESGYLR